MYNSFSDGRQLLKVTPSSQSDAFKERPVIHDIYAGQESEQEFGQESEHQWSLREVGQQIDGIKSTTTLPSLPAIFQLY